jgi:ParB family chromosome partitioning protein
MAANEGDAKPAGKKTTTRGRKKKPVEPATRGLTTAQVAQGSPPAALQKLIGAIEQDGGSVLATFRDPLGGQWQILAALPVALVHPTPFQRDLSETHAARLAHAIDGLDRFLDPVIAVRAEEGVYWTPNGLHRTEAVRSLGGRTITALVIPEKETAYRILALNTEKAHNLREKCLEVIRMARSLAELDPRPESEYALEFEEPAFLTLGICYEKRGRFSGGVYQPVVKRVEAFLRASLSKALETRAERVERLLELDDLVIATVAKLKERGLESAYLKNFVVARINPLRFQRGAKAEFDETITKMIQAARRFDVGKIKADQVAQAGGAPEE